MFTAEACCACDEPKYLERASFFWSRACAAVRRRQRVLWAARPAARALRTPGALCSKGPGRRRHARAADAANERILTMMVMRPTSMVSIMARNTNTCSCSFSCSASSHIVGEAAGSTPGPVVSAATVELEAMMRSTLITASADGRSASGSASGSASRAADRSAGRAAACSPKLGRDAGSVGRGSRPQMCTGSRSLKYVPRRRGGHNRQSREKAGGHAGSTQC